MTNFKKAIIFFMFCLFFFNQTTFAKQEDKVYSQEYFDYLIEKSNSNSKDERNIDQEEIPLVEVEQNYVSLDNIEPFKLRILKDLTVSPYGETYKVIDTKIIMPIANGFNFYQNTRKTRNKYNSNDYKILAGAEAGIGIFSIASGLETNFRSYDQLPTSRKVYLTPSVNLTDKITLKMHNKINVNSHIQDCDLELNLSPLKSKSIDFGVYAGTRRLPSGYHTESINFSTNLYLF